MLTEILQLLLSCSRYTKGVFLPPKAIQFRGFHIAWKGTDERENANILPCCLPTCPNDWFSPLQLRKKKRIIHSLHNILEVRQECQFRILKKFLRYMYHSGLVKVLSLQIFKMNQIPIFIMGWIIWWDPKTLTPHAKFEAIKPSFGLSTRSPFYGSIVLK